MTLQPIDLTFTYPTKPADDDELMHALDEDDLLSPTDEDDNSSGYDTDKIESDSDDEPQLRPRQRNSCPLHLPPANMPLFTIGECPPIDSVALSPRLRRFPVKSPRDRSSGRHRFHTRSSERISARFTAIRDSSSSIRARDVSPGGLPRTQSVQSSLQSLSINSPIRTDTPDEPVAVESDSPCRSSRRRTLFARSRTMNRLSAASVPILSIRPTEEEADEELPEEISSSPLRSSLPGRVGRAPTFDSFMLDIPTPLPLNVSCPVPIPTPLNDENAPENQVYKSNRRRALTQSTSICPAAVRRTVSDLSPTQGGGHRHTGYSGLPASVVRHAGNNIADYDMHNLAYPPLLPLLKKKQFDLIASSTVVDLMQGRYTESFDQVFIIDCRYMYEFEGGHIKTALSIIPSQLEQRLQEMFLESPIVDRKVAVVFHCEFSSKRGPKACETLRKMDRLANRKNYPRLHYPYVYVMEGGYQHFVRDWPAYCQGGYIEMKDKRYVDRLRWNKRQDRRAKNARSSSATLARRPSGNVLSRSHQSLSFSSFE